MNKFSVLLISALACVFACSQGNPASPGADPPNQVKEETTPSPETLSDSDASVPEPATESDSGSPKTQPDAADAGPKEPTTQAECLTKCETDHPEGKLKADAISACWTASCSPSCTHMPDRGPTNVSPAVETKVCAGDGLSLQTPSPTCSQCTHDNCCTQWLECFSSLQSDCVKLNECANQCWKDFPN